MNASYKHCNYVSMKANVCLISWHGEIHYQISLDKFEITHCRNNKFGKRILEFEVHIMTYILFIYT